MRPDPATFTRAIQDQLPDQPCWGCGPKNPHGLQIKSYWSGETTVCTWQPEPHYAGWPGLLNGGILAIRMVDTPDLLIAGVMHD
ncbi:MAG: hypothetical protein JO352_23180 [Chloroflexi bacterium]|nr:hypothetical protein [Chloroflexota bacterium]MBV9597820.1 hypothetical protein [Chloroflexota bacterium]